MLTKIKRMIQKPFVDRIHRRYEKRLREELVTDGEWICALMEEERRETEEWLQNSENRQKLPTVGTVTYRELYEAWRAGAGLPGADVILLAADRSGLVPCAEAMVGQYFAENGDVKIAYSDETDWMKPEWSPDLLQSIFYFGHVWAVRAECLRDQMSRMAEGDAAPAGVKAFLYELALGIMDREEKAGRILRFLFDPAKLTGETAAEFGGDWGTEPEFDGLKRGHRYSDIEVPEKKEEQELVSVIIPSKDHPEVLQCCLDSLCEYTAYRNLEILVVDNGSSDENRSKIGKLLEKVGTRYPVTYLYEPMEFNFSRMCNLGAARAKGNYLLFLNDDIEIAVSEWMTRMVRKAGRPDAGAVGAKLFYPETNMIQHCGVVAIHLGPAHKLQFARDDKSYNHGFNHMPVNVITVTGACMMMRREVFDRAGGFREDLAVAFNDVELGFHIFELGYHNICCNDIYLYHHESLSRGSDAALPKVERLHREHRLIYELYPDRWKYDPYYSPRFARDVLERYFKLACRFEEGERSLRVTARRFSKALKPEWNNACLFGGVEYVGDEKRWRDGVGAGGDYYIQGWFYTLHADNSRYRKSLLLKPLESREITFDEMQAPGETMWEIPFTECLRKDLEENIEGVDSPYAAFAGVSVWIPRRALPEGEYLLGFYWEDRCSRQKLYRFTPESLKVEYEPENV